MMVNMGKLICLSGLDGSGKTTQSKLIAKYFQSKNKKVNMIHLKESVIMPEKLMESFRQYIKSHSISDAKTIRNVLSAMLFVEKVNDVILPSLMKYDLTIVNRYIESALCYHFLKNGLTQYVTNIYNGLPIPDANFYIDVSPDICFQRIKSREKLNEFENIANLNKAYDFYTTCKDQFIWINGEEDMLNICSNIVKKIEEM